MNYRPCFVCAKVFSVKPGRFAKRITCSVKCFGVYNTGIRNPNWRGGKSNKVSRVCLNCGKSFYCLPYTKGKYCGRWCMNKKQAQDSKERAIIRRALNPNKKYKRKYVPGEKVIKARTTPVCPICGKHLRKSSYKACPGECYRKFNPPKDFSHTFKCKICGKEQTRKKYEVTKYCGRECSNKDKHGPANGNYKGGITPIHKKIRASEEYKQWRISVFERDNYTCVHCGQVGWKLHVDHIKPFSLFPELRLDVNNGRTLCVECHKKTDTFMKGNSKKFRALATEENGKLVIKEFPI